jgi:pimeloyl-ACP methyl ester carboxylesterase
VGSLRIDAKRRPSWSRRAILGGWLGAGLFALHVVASGAVASAVALAPNASRLDGTPRLSLPPALAERGARSSTISVGPPAASLASWIVPARGRAPKATVLLLHGIRMDKRSLAPMAIALSDAGYRSVLVDLRGHGDSTGRYLTYGSVESRDLSLVLDALGDHRPGCTGAYGFSYGAAVAIELSARDERIGAVVSAAPFSSLREVTEDYERKYLPAPLKLVPDAWFQRAVDSAGHLANFDPDRAAPVLSVKGSRAALLLIHGTADTQVPLRHSLAIARAAGERAELMELPGAAHDDLPSDRTGAVRRATVAWFERWSSQSACAPGVR